jgi:hypothetical protein
LLYSEELNKIIVVTTGKIELIDAPHRDRKSYLNFEGSQNILAVKRIGGDATVALKACGTIIQVWRKNGEYFETIPKGAGDLRGFKKDESNLIRNEQPNLRGCYWP